MTPLLTLNILITTKLPNETPFSRSRRFFAFVGGKGREAPPKGVRREKRRQFPTANIAHYTSFSVLENGGEGASEEIFSTFLPKTPIFRFFRRFTRRLCGEAERFGRRRRWGRDSETTIDVPKERDAEILPIGRTTPVARRGKNRGLETLEKWGRTRFFRN